jgi:hypothetical protein
MYRYGKGEIGGACIDMGKVKWLEHVQVWERLNGCSMYRYVKGEMAGACTDFGMVNWVEHV